MSTVVTNGGIIPPTIVLPVGTVRSDSSVDTEESLVFDARSNHWVLMNRQMAKLQLKASRPSPFRYWGLRALAGVGAVAIVGMAATTFLFVKERFAQGARPEASTVIATTSTPNNVAVVGVIDERTAPKATQVSETQPKLSVSGAGEPLATTTTPAVKSGDSSQHLVTTPPGQGHAQAKNSAVSAAARQAVRVSSDSSEPAPAAKNPAPKPAPAPEVKQAAKTPQKTLAPVNSSKAAGPESPKTAAPAAPSPSPVRPVDVAGTTSSAPAAAPKTNAGWAVKVEPNGVIFFDGSKGKLVRVGDQLPSGERLVDVDPGSSTYATDKGIRQIRSTSLQSGKS